MLARHCGFALLMTVAAAALASGARAETLSLTDALAVAYETNPQLEAARAGLRATDENVSQADSNFRPSAGANLSYGYEKIPPVFGGTPISHPLSTQLQVTQPILNFSNFAQLGKAEEQVKSGRAQLVFTEETVLLNAATAYFDVVRDEAILKLRQDFVVVLERQRDATQEQRRVGTLTRTDVAQSQARLAGAQSDLVNAQAQVAISRSNFEHVIGRPAGTLESEPILPILPKEEQAALDLAHKLNPSLEAARHNVSAADYAVQQAEGALLPQVNITAGYGYSQSNPAFGATTIYSFDVMTNLTIPIYQGGGEDASIRQAKELRSQADLTVSEVERQVTDAVHTVWQSYLAAAATITSSQAQLEANMVADQGVRAEQRVGSRTIIEILNAQQELLNSQVALAVSKHNTAVAAYQLLSAVGTLTAKDRALHVNVYDPVAHYDSETGRWIGLGN